MNEQLLLVFYKVKKKKNIRYLIKLPYCPTQLTELKTVKYWLEQIFISVFYVFRLEELTLNHEMIKFLFKDEI
ncbi:hypothetical protein Mgra_00003918 [Meloidogyne graminicola]|uniref:Uncharacterized protein n=1 Tax=Meloidogyne graminicola TaxID=189291 RepID=A0A8S9ZTZ2_9BILA|nr:hypothetical protein Mgra_00003918 [Meloidogyne graminicola]